jgi:hypothetical protein
LAFLISLVSLVFGLTTVSSCFLIWLDVVRDQPVPIRGKADIAQERAKDRFDPTRTPAFFAI